MLLSFLPGMMAAMRVATALGGNRRCVVCGTPTGDHLAGCTPGLRKVTAERDRARLTQSSPVLHRHMPDGFMYELRRGGKGWEARRQEGEPWQTARSVAFALIRAMGPMTAQQVDAFNVAVRKWEKELRHA